MLSTRTHWREEEDAVLLAEGAEVASEILENRTLAGCQRRLSRLAELAEDSRIPVDTPFRTADLSAFDLVAEAAQPKQRERMQTPSLTHQIKPIRTKRKFGVAWMSDLHIGSDGVDYGAIKADCAKIIGCADLKVFVGGDPIDNFIIPKMRDARDTGIATVDEQYAAFKDLVSALKGKILALGAGNHDAWTREIAGIDLIRLLAGQTNLPFAGESAWFDLTVGQVTYAIHRCHRPASGSFAESAARSAYAKGPWLYDLCVFEHHHSPQHGSFLAHGSERHYLKTGSYKLHDDYALKHGFHNTRIGVPVTIFDPYNKEILIVPNLDTAITILDHQ